MSRVNWTGANLDLYDKYYNEGQMEPAKAVYGLRKLQAQLDREGDMPFKKAWAAALDGYCDAVTDMLEESNEA